MPKRRLASKVAGMFVEDGPSDMYGNSVLPLGFWEEDRATAPCFTSHISYTLGGIGASLCRASLGVEFPQLHIPSGG